MCRHLSILLFIGLAFGQNISVYIPKIDLFGFELSTWYLLGWVTIFFGKIVILYYGYNKGWNFSKWLTLILFATTGAAIGSLFLPTIVGTLIGFIGCLIFGKRLLGFQHDIGIIVALFITIAFAIGRIGCLFNGCCFGSVTTLPWGINYPIGTPAHWLHLFSDFISNSHSSSLSIHPIQFYETIFHLFSAILIIKLGKRFKNSHTVLLHYFGSYLIFRFFIEFIRDMNNVWWSALSFGPLTLFQWFLFFMALGLIISGVVLEKNHKSVLIKGKTNHIIKNDFIIILFCFIVTLIFKKQIQTIHLVQLAIILPISTFLNLIELRKRYTFFYPVPRYVTASICALLFSTPIISQIESRLDSNQSINTSQKDNSKRWIYTMNEHNNTLLRIGNRGMTSQEFNRRKQLLNLFSNQAIVWAQKDYDKLVLKDGKEYLGEHIKTERKMVYFKKQNEMSLSIISMRDVQTLQLQNGTFVIEEKSDSKNIYDEMKNNNESGIQYYGSIGGGKQSFTVHGCDSESSYDIFHLSAGYGGEKIKIKKSAPDSFEKTTVKGIRGNLGFSSGQATSTITEYGGPFGVTNEGTTYTSSNYSNLYLSINAYGNLEFKWFGFGLGPSLAFTSSSSPILIYPNAHLRLGPAKFNLQAGISDRYVGVYNPISAHLSFSGFILKNKTPIQIGIMNQYFEFPFATAGAFIQFGNSKSFTIIAGESGASIALRHNFLK